MTNFKQAQSNGRRGMNIKDGRKGCPKSQRQSTQDAWESAGFTFVKPPSTWAYTWPGDFPVFQIKPGWAKVNGEKKNGLVASNVTAGIHMFLPYGTQPAEIATQLDDEILSIMRYDAALEDDAADWIDIDAWMTQ
jgi:hypothetical protein